MRTRLSPFVYKIKGKKNYLLFDAIKKLIYKITPQGGPFEMENELIKNELVIKTNGVVPIKFQPNIGFYKTNLILRELQIRINGKCGNDCPECAEVGNCIQDEKVMTLEILNKIFKQLKHINIKSVVIIGGNPLLEIKMIHLIREKIVSSKYKVFLKKTVISEETIRKLKESDVVITDRVCGELSLTEEDMDVDVNNFFYNQSFNPCWGNKIAIDVNGDIKPCMWVSEVIGNISESSIKDMIFSNIFNQYWELSKDKFDICRDCEFRYLCSDCRVKTLKESASITSKTTLCKYNPETGEWK